MSTYLINHGHNIIDICMPSRIPNSWLEIGLQYSCAVTCYDYCSSYKNFNVWCNYGTETTGQLPKRDNSCVHYLKGVHNNMLYISSAFRRHCLNCQQNDVGEKQLGQCMCSHFILEVESQQEYCVKWWLFSDTISQSGTSVTKWAGCMLRWYIRATHWACSVQPLYNAVEPLIKGHSETVQRVTSVQLELLIKAL